MGDAVEARHKTGSVMSIKRYASGLTGHANNIRNRWVHLHFVVAPSDGQCTYFFIAAIYVRVRRPKGFSESERGHRGVVVDDLLRRLGRDSGETVFGLVL